MKRTEISHDDVTLKDYIVKVYMKDGRVLKKIKQSTSSIKLLYELTPIMYAWKEYPNVSGWCVENA